MLYFITKKIKWNFFKIMPLRESLGLGLTISIIIFHTHPIFYIINYLRFGKITFSMILIKYQLVLK